MLYGYKGVIDKYFNDNWMHTPIQYDGILFVMPTSKEWVSIQLIPFSREDRSFGGGVNEEKGIIKIYTYGASSTLSYLLAAKVQEFLDEIHINDLFVNVGYPDGNGVISLHDGIYESLTLYKVEISTKK